VFHLNFLTYKMHKCPARVVVSIHFNMSSFSAHHVFEPIFKGFKIVSMLLQSYENTEFKTMPALNSVCFCSNSVEHWLNYHLISLPKILSILYFCLTHDLKNVSYSKML
jgi:hypothetical protein